MPRLECQLARPRLRGIALATTCDIRRSDTPPLDYRTDSRRLPLEWDFALSWRVPALGARATWTRTITAEEAEAFARFSGYRNPPFRPAFAARTPVGRFVVQGGLTTALFNARVAMEPT